MMNRIKYIILTLLLCCITSPTFSKTIIGIGTGKTEKVAKDMALKDLIENISVEVFSNSETELTQTEDDFEEDSRMLISSNSKHFLIGVKFTSTKIKTGYKIKAVLDDESFELYKNKIRTIDEEINELYSYKGDYSTQIKYLNEVEKKLVERKKLEEVLVLVGEKAPKNNNVSTVNLKSKKSTLIKKSQIKDRVYISMKGYLNEGERRAILNSIKRNVDSSKIVIVPDDREVEYFVDIEITELFEKEIPETMVRPGRFGINFNCVIFVVDEKTGKEILRTNIPCSIEAFDRYNAREEMLKKISENVSLEIQKIL